MRSSKTTQVPQSFSFITHMDTRHLRWATLVAFCKRRDELVPSDLLAGIYIANLERVSKFWPSPDLFEDFVAEHCDWSEPRWLTWQRWQQETENASRRWRLPFGIHVTRVGKLSKHFYGSVDGQVGRSCQSPHRESRKTNVLTLAIHVSSTSISLSGNFG